MKSAIETILKPPNNLEIIAEQRKKNLDQFGFQNHRLKIQSQLQGS
jgi:hypothetical protein